MSTMKQQKFSIVGGVYYERCMKPSWDDIYGSAGRAAAAITAMGGDVELFSYVDPVVQDVLADRAAWNSEFKTTLTLTSKSVAFDYHHGLGNPSIAHPGLLHPPLEVQAERVLRFGMLEGDAVIDAEYAVYDPQDATNPRPFHENGSKAQHLALVLNQQEAGLLVRDKQLKADTLIKAVAEQEKAEIVVMKRGPLGCMVWENGMVNAIPAYRTDRVWKIGSGDNFAAQFAYQWMKRGGYAIAGAMLASKATAYYCQTRRPPTTKQLEEFSPDQVTVSSKFESGYRPLVYLAGPFFTLAQLWLIEQARDNLISLGLRVFSPFHDVGHGSAEDVVQKDIEAIEECDLMFAIFDGLDPGTIYEVGYARAIKKPVVMYCENESKEDQKMMEGSDCQISDDYVTAIYKTLWTATSL